MHYKNIPEKEHYCLPNLCPLSKVNAMKTTLEYIDFTVVSGTIHLNVVLDPLYLESFLLLG